MEERGRHCVVPDVREVSGDLLDVVGHTARLVDDDHRPRRVAFGHAGVETHRAVGGVEGDGVDLHAFVLPRPSSEIEPRLAIDSEVRPNLPEWDNGLVA